MKIRIVTLLFCLFACSAFAQNEAKYRAVLMEKVKELDEVSTLETIENLAFDFERIAEMEKDKWLPRYYAAYCNMRLSMFEKEVESMDELLSKAENFCTQAEALDPDFSELKALKARIILMRIKVDFYNRGPGFTTRAKDMLAEALELNPDNPRALLVTGLLYYYTPPMFGGSTENACKVFSQTKQAYIKEENNVDRDEVLPHWGSNMTTKLLSECPEQATVKAQ